MVYSFFLFVALLLYAPLYFFRMRIGKGERLYLRDRLGLTLPKRTSSKKAIWIHAVSVGEVLSLQSLVKQLKARHPTWEVNFSSLTNTGLRMAKKKLQDADNIFFVPLDFSLTVRRFFASIKPRLFILAESEFWPNLLRVAKKKCRAVLLINGRISSRSFKRYSRFRRLAGKILKNVDHFMVQTEQDKERLRRIGVPPEKVEISGNLKSEIDLPPMGDIEVRAIKENLSLASDKKVLTAGSTRKGEEEILLEAFVEARKTARDIALILAPRHMDRCGEVEKVCLDLGLKVGRRTAVSAGEEWDVLLLDTMGELAYFYALADAAFIGGSLVPWGGHNLLEPAFYAKPVYFGPHMDNFAFIADAFVRSGGACIVSEKKDLTDMFLMKDHKLLEEMGRRAKKTLDSLQGVTEKTLKLIETIMGDDEEDS